MERSPKKHKEYTISDVIVEKQKVNPIIVDFKNGTPTEKALRNYKYELYRDESRKQILAVSDDRMVYKGHRPDPKNELMQTMIGVYNKKKGTMRLIKCEKWEMTPVLGKLPADLRTEFDVTANATVNKEFGSKKAKRRTEQFEKMKIDIDTVTEQLESVVNNISINEENLTSVASDDFTSSNIPPVNRLAESVFDVYNPYDILPKEVLETLYEFVDDVLENKFPDATPFFNNLVEIAQKSTHTQKKVASIIYTRALTKWLAFPIKEVRRIGFVQANFNISYDAASYIIKTYSTSNSTGRLRPPMLRDKAIIHCMLLVLFANNYMINLEEFSKATKAKIGIRKMIDFARVLRLTSQKDKSVFVLKMPLPPPVNTTNVKKRKHK